MLALKVLSVSILHRAVCIAEAGASVSAFTGLILFSLDGFVVSFLFFCVGARCTPAVVMIVILN